VIEIRFHGRGGQGSVVASELLAEAAFVAGRSPQSFPFFGVERRGAPVTAYCRVDDRPIRVRTSVTTPDIVVVLDPGLLRTIPVTDGLKEGGLLLVNSGHGPESLATPVRAVRASVDADRIAVALGLGSPTMPIVNTTMLGALARVSGIVPSVALEQAVRASAPREVDRNVEAIRRGFAEVRVAEGESLPLVRPRAVRAATVLPDAPLASRPSDELHTASWRTLVPTIDRARCTRCNFCWKFCPDDAYGFDADGYPVLRAAYCKGCGICAVECPPHAIAMVADEGGLDP